MILPIYNSGNRNFNKKFFESRTFSPQNYYKIWKNMNSLLNLKKLIKVKV